MLTGTYMKLKERI